jgi:hypothetical protein
MDRSSADKGEDQQPDVPGFSGLPAGPVSTQNLRYGMGHTQMLKVVKIKEQISYLS